MSRPLDDLRTSLVRLHRGGVRSGLPAARADALVRALDEGAPIQDAAAASGLDRRVAGVAERAGVSDLPRVIARLAELAAEVDAGSGRLRAAGTYPLVLAVSVVVPGLAMAELAFPALARLPAAAGAPLGEVLAGTLAATVLLLLALAVVVLGRLPLPWISAGRICLDRFAFLQSVALLCRAGRPLPRALRASTPWVGASGRAAAEGLAHALESGAAGGEARPLLDPFEAAMLVGAAGTGTAPEATAALAEQHRVTLARVLPDAVVRIQATAVVLAGLAVLAIGGGFFWAYSRAVLP